jgi:hypothetical protein
MSTRLDSKPQIHTLASDLGLQPSAKPCQRIVQFVEMRVKKIVKTFACKTLNDLLIAVANDVGQFFARSTQMPISKVSERNTSLKGS